MGGIGRPSRSPADLLGRDPGRPPDGHTRLAYPIIDEYGSAPRANITNRIGEMKEGRKCSFMRRSSFEHFPSFIFGACGSYASPWDALMDCPFLPKRCYPLRSGTHISHRRAAQYYPAPPLQKEWTYGSTRPPAIGWRADPAQGRERARGIAALECCVCHDRSI